MVKNKGRFFAAFSPLFNATFFVYFRQSFFFSFDGVIFRSLPSYMDFIRFYNNFVVQIKTVSSSPSKWGNILTVRTSCVFFSSVYPQTQEVEHAPTTQPLMHRCTIKNCIFSDKQQPIDEIFHRKLIGIQFTGLTF